MLHAEDLTWPDADARLRVAHNIAREMDDRALVDRIVSTGKQVKADIQAKRLEAAETRVQAVEREVGIDPGGWSINGLRIFRPTKEIVQASKQAAKRLADAMRREDEKGIEASIDELRSVFGDQVGTPDARHRGMRAERRPVTDAEVVDLFLQALGHERERLRYVHTGKPVPDMKARYYAGLVKACCAIRPSVEAHRPETVREIDELVENACGVMTGLQLKEGYFPLPDLRGKSIRFGEITERALRQDPNAVKDGWLVALDPGGGCQFDAGECGTALLAAGKAFDRQDWTDAGLRAAEWALEQPCVPNFNYNAFSVGLLAQAYRATGEERYLEGALKKFRLGVAPGQVENGRWIDPHNARTVYHLIIIRGLHDLCEALPDTHAEARAEVAAVAAKAVRSVIDEFEAVGVTDRSFPVQELIRHERLATPPDGRIRGMIELAASVACGRCFRGKRVGFGAAPGEVVALREAWGERTRRAQ